MLLLIVGTPFPTTDAGRVSGSHRLLVVVLVPLGTLAVAEGLDLVTARLMITRVEDGPHLKFKTLGELWLTLGVQALVLLRHPVI